MGEEGRGVGRGRASVKGGGCYELEPLFLFTIPPLTMETLKDADAKARNLCSLS